MDKKPLIVPTAVFRSTAFIVLLIFTSSWLLVYWAAACGSPMLGILALALIHLPGLHSLVKYLTMPFGTPYVLMPRNEPKGVNYPE